MGLLPILLLAACAAPGAGGAGAQPGALPASARALADRGPEPGVDGSTGDGPNAVQTESHALDPGELSVWSDPLFKRRFAEGFLAESDVEPSVSALEREKLEKAMQLLGEDRLDDAVAQLEALAGTGASAMVDYYLGNAYARLERPERAAACYTTAIGKHPRFRRAWKSQGLMHFRAGDHAAAAAELARVVELGGGDALTFGLLGFAQFQQESFVAAESAYRMATLLDPATLDWQVGMARTLFKLQRFGDATALFTTLLDKNPDRADFWLYLANAHLGTAQQLGAQQGLAEVLAAAQCYEMVGRLGKATADTELRLADIYTNAEIHDLAVAAYVRALTLDEKAPAERALLAADLMVRRGAAGDAKVLLGKVTELRGGTLTAAARRDLLHVRARIALAEGADDEQAAVLEQVLALDPLDGDALIRLGQYRAAKGELEAAIALYERAAGIEAFEPDALVRHAQLLVKQGKYADGIKLLRRAQTIKPRDNIEEYLQRVERFAQARS